MSTGNCLEALQEEGDETCISPAWVNYTLQQASTDKQLERQNNYNQWPRIHH